MKMYNNEKVIVSLTSHGIRLSHVAKTIFSILSNSFKDIHIVLTVSQDDSKSLPDDLVLFIDNDLIELLVCNTDLGPHTKYFYAMKKYKNTPIITIDDDGIYDVDTVKSLYDMYLTHNDCICARRVHNILFDNDTIKPYRQWKFEYKGELNPSMQLFATGVGGVLYPPNILEISDANLNEINECLWADDVYLKVLEIRKHIKVIWVPNKHVHPSPFGGGLDRILKDKGLWLVNTLQDRNDTYIHHFISDFKTIKPC